MPKPLKTNAPDLLAKNLRALKMGHVQLKTEMAIAKAAGVAQSSVHLMLNPGSRRTPTTSGKAPSPVLRDVEKVANAFGLQTWQLLIDPEMLGEVIAAALSGKAATNEKLESAGIHAPKETQETS